MTRKRSLLLIVIVVSLFVTTAVLAAKSYYAERFDVLIDIQENGSAIIIETVEFRFEGDPFTFAFREISATETDGITFLDASMDGVPMPQGTLAGQVEVEPGDPLKVTWHFPQPLMRRMSSSSAIARMGSSAKGTRTPSSGAQSPKIMITPSHIPPSH